MEKIKPLWRSITIGCFLFICTLCIILGITSYFNYKNSLYQRYQIFIQNILIYVDGNIDDDDLAECVRTGVRSEKYDELEKFMDSVLEDFDIHYLYAITPIHKNGEAKMMSVMSAERYHDRYIDTEGNLYLGWISDDEYDEKTVNQFFEYLKKKDISFFEEKTEWSTDYTGALPLVDSQGNPYALLCVDVDVSTISKLIRRRTFEIFGLIILIGFLFMGLFLFWMYRNFTNPIRKLEECVVAFAEKSHGQRDTACLQFDPPQWKIRNELSELSNAVNQMTIDMRDYVEGILLAERNAEIMKQHATHMTELANQDSLTGIRNKTAYDREVRKMEYDLDMGVLIKFGIIMIDLNFLKKINDTYGHEQGNYAIKKLCEIVCTVFAHSPVFRIGGDEFVVILKDSDYASAYALIADFKHTLFMMEKDKSLEPWQQISAAIGIAEYDAKLDKSVTDVFNRADAKMYECKKAMKGERKD